VGKRRLELCAQRLSLLLQRDGLFVVLGHLANVLTVIYFTVLIVGGGAAIRELFLRLSGSA
jgi:hypothetical protein